MKRIIYIVFFITIVFNLNGCMYKSQTEISNQIWSGRWKCKEISMEIWSNDLDALNTNVEEYKNSMICGYVQFDNKTRNIYDIGIDDYFKEIVVYFDDGMTIEMGIMGISNVCS